jgi:hypothetical protein
VDAVARQAVEAAGRDDLVLVSAVPDGDAVVVTVAVTVERIFVRAFGDPRRDTRTIAARADGVVRRPAP